MATWEERIIRVLGPRGYENSMRRPLQTIILHEANRCVGPLLPSLRPFQRKVAYWDMANALVQSLSFLLPYQKVETMWRTGTSREPMNPETAWKRRKLLNKELEKIASEVRPLMQGRTHDEACELYIQQQYEAVTSNTKPHPRNWEHAHNNVTLCYRLYYDNGHVDPTFPAPSPPKEILVAPEKQKTNPSLAPPVVVSSFSGAQPRNNQQQQQQQHHHEQDEEVDAELEKIVSEGVNAEDRRRTLEEVKEHLALLKEFEGVISEEDLAKRKRELFIALPPAPPPVPQQQGSLVNNNNNNSKRKRHAEDEEV